jgi:hypothetical protein
MRNVLLVGGLYTDRRKALVRATIDCAAAVDWDHVLEAVDDRPPPLPGGAAAAEVMCARNWQALNRAALDLHPDARRVVYGDGIGVVDTDRGSSAPQFDLAMLAIPQPELPGVLDGQPLEVIPMATLREVVDTVRAKAPGLAETDAALAEFARGGVLALLGNLTEARMTTLNGELRQARALLERVLRPGCSLVIKPHPRASLGQATALARVFRAKGHPVRVMGPSRHGAYPIETFPQLVRSVETVQPGQSSSAVSLAALYEVLPRAELPTSLARTTLFPHVWNRACGVIAHHARTLRTLPSWDGRTPLPDAPVLTPSRLQSLLAGPCVPLVWTPRSGGHARPGAHDAPRLMAAAARHVAPQSPARAVLQRDAASGTTWAFPPGTKVEPLSAEPAGDAIERIGRIAAASAASLAGAPVAVVAAARPPTHAPRWRHLLERVRPSRMPDLAAGTGEEIEEAMEAAVDLELRARDSGHVLLLGRAR